MRVDEIKANYSMRDVLARCGIETDRHGFCKCCFHKGDNTASLKIYNDGFYCYGCGAGGDQITFVRLFHGLEFKEACEWISGEALTRETTSQMAIARMKRKEKEKAKERLKQELKKVNEAFSGLWQKVLNAEPLSEEWKTAYNKWEFLCYQQEELIKELGEL